MKRGVIFYLIGIVFLMVLFVECHPVKRIGKLCGKNPIACEQVMRQNYTLPKDSIIEKIQTHTILIIDTIRDTIPGAESEMYFDWNDPDTVFITVNTGISHDITSDNRMTTIQSKCKDHIFLKIIKHQTDTIKVFKEKYRIYERDAQRIRQRLNESEMNRAEIEGRLKQVRKQRNTLGLILLLIIIGTGLYFYVKLKSK